jgi:hypothetical protein
MKPWNLYHRSKTMFQTSEKSFLLRTEVATVEVLPGHGEKQKHTSAIVPVCCGTSQRCANNLFNGYFRRS